MQPGANHQKIYMNIFKEFTYKNTCTVCGLRTRFREFTENKRESGRCIRCNSFNRQRQIAYVLRNRLRLPARGSPPPPLKNLSIYNVEANGAVHKALSVLPKYMCSEYFGDTHKPGEIINGIRNEDLQRLSFPDQVFDIILSSDVLEHMPDPYTAHHEIFRVLKPGGRHIFTVPYNHAAERDDVRARIVNGEIEYISEKIYHGDPVRPNEGVLVWTIFGKGMIARLNEIGFVTSEFQLNFPEYGIVGEGATVFEALKP